MPATDTEASLINEMTALVRRAIALGRKMGSEETTARILRAASGDVATSGSTHTETPERKPLRILAKPGAGPRGGRKYPYGYVTGALEQTFKDHPDGIRREAVDTYINETLKKNIDAEAIRNAIKQLMRTNRILRKGDLLFWSGQ